MATASDPQSPSISETLSKLATALTSTASTLPASLQTPEHSLSLLTTKNELLLSYLHNLSFLALLRLKGESFADHPVIDDLVRLRLLFERGIRPLEGRLKYQIDKVVSAAQEAENKAQQRAAGGRGGDNAGDDAESSSSSSGSGTEDSDEEEETKRGEERKSAFDPTPSELSFRANPSAFVLDNKAGPGEERREKEQEKTGLYRPPRIAATAMPDFPTTAPSERRAREPTRSRALDDFISTELSSAPVAEPSIGTTIASGGRAVKTAQERRLEAERREYEEANFVRLPKPSKKERREERRKGQGARDNAFGGEDWRSFAGDLDRLTRRAGGKSKGERLLERARKRRGDDDDRGEVNIGGHFEGRKRIMRKRRKV